MVRSHCAPPMFIRKVNRTSAPERSRKPLAPEGVGGRTSAFRQNMGRCRGWLPKQSAKLRWRDCANGSMPSPSATPL